MAAPMKTRLAAFAAVLLRDGIGLVGIGLLVHGVASIYEPAAYIVAGAFALGAAVLLSLRSGRAG